MISNQWVIVGEPTFVQLFERILVVGGRFDAATTNTANDIASTNNETSTRTMHHATSWFIKAFSSLFSSRSRLVVPPDNSTIVLSLWIVFLPLQSLIAAAVSSKCNYVLNWQETMGFQVKIYHCSLLWKPIRNSMTLIFINYWLLIMHNEVNYSSTATTFEEESCRTQIVLMVYLQSTAS